MKYRIIRLSKPVFIALFAVLATLLFFACSGVNPDNDPEKKERELIRSK